MQHLGKMRSGLCIDQVLTWNGQAGLLPSSTPALACAREAVVLLQSMRGCERSDITGIKAFSPCGEKGHSTLDRSAELRLIGTNT